MVKSSVIRRYSIVAAIALALPAFAAPQHHGGGGFAAPAAGRAIAMASHATPVRGGGRAQFGTQAQARVGTPMARTRNGVRINNRNNRANFGFNGTDFNGTDFQNVPGLGFDYPHLAAVSGNRRFRNGGFGGGFPFGFGGGFLWGPSVIPEDVPIEESQIAGAQSSAADQQEFADDTQPVQRAPRRSRSSRQAEPEADSAPAPPRDDEQYVFVRRDGSLVFAVAYSWESGTLRYITPDGLRRSIGRDALDLDATQQFNEQRGLNFHVPA
jgi:hypothetical protein